ncbi:MAG: hypothetical protein ABSA93_15285 [Streptosporangiaceae bacterium]
MRLRIFERVRRFALRAGSRRGPRDGTALEAPGRHRRERQAVAVPHHHVVPPRPIPHQPVVPAARATVGRPAAPRPAAPRPAAAGAGAAAGYGGAARARIREAPPGAPQSEAQAAPPVVNHERARQPWYQVVKGYDPPSAEALPTLAPPPRRGIATPTEERLAFAAPHPTGMPPTPDGRRNTGVLEKILWRQWDPSMPPPADVVIAIDRLADFPQSIKNKLADGLDGIYVGPGGVPELDDMTSLRGVPLPSGRATWDACAGAYGERKIVIGSRPSPTPDVTCHEVGHALDDLDSPPGKWQSDSAEFRMLYDLCQPHLVSDFHRQPGGLGRKEFFADAFAAIASSQRPALVDMLGGQTRTALRVMLYFNRRYGL